MQIQHLTDVEKHLTINEKCCEQWKLTPKTLHTNEIGLYPVYELWLRYASVQYYGSPFNMKLFRRIFTTNMLLPCIKNLRICNSLKFLFGSP